MVFFLPAVALRREDGSAAPLQTTVGVARGRSLISIQSVFLLLYYDEAADN